MNKSKTNGTDGSVLGVALQCDSDGVILKILRDDLNCLDREKIGRTLLSIVSDEDVKKGLNFIVELKQRDAAFNSEMRLRNTEVYSGILHFVGGRVDEHFVIVGSTSKDAAGSLYQEMIRMNNEHINMLRASMSDQGQSEKIDDIDQDFYSDFTRLNNELVDLQRNLFKKNRELELLNETKNQFIGMAAHDLRNPLGSFTQVIDLILSGDLGEVSPEQREFLEMLGKSSASMLQLVNDLLDISQIESGKLDLDKRKIGIKEFLLENQLLHRVMAEKKGILLEYEYPQEDLTLVMDPDRISQVLNNLITNAIKFSPADGEIRLSVKNNAHEIVFAVHDDGPGIPPEEHEKLFKPFAKLSVKSSTGEKSSGLGLAISRKMVECHGGRIWAESAPGEGSSFYFSLPKE